MLRIEVFTKVINGNISGTKSSCYFKVKFLMSINLAFKLNECIQ